MVLILRRHSDAENHLVQQRQGAPQHHDGVLPRGHAQQQAGRAEPVPGPPAQRVHLPGQQLLQAERDRQRHDRAEA